MVVTADFTVICEWLPRNLVDVCCFKGACCLHLYKM